LQGRSSAAAAFAIQRMLRLKTSDFIRTLFEGRFFDDKISVFVAAKRGRCAGARARRDKIFSRTFACTYSPRVSQNIVGASAHCAGPNDGDGMPIVFSRSSGIVAENSRMKVHDRGPFGLQESIEGIEDLVVIFYGIRRIARDCMDEFRHRGGFLFTSGFQHRKERIQAHILVLFHELLNTRQVGVGEAREYFFDQIQIEAAIEIVFGVTCSELQSQNFFEVSRLRRGRETLRFNFSSQAMIARGDFGFQAEVIF